MDYLKQPITFKLRKVLRYATIYGVRRTYVKVRGYARGGSLEQSPYVGLPKEKQSIALIGCGNYCFTNIAYYLTKRYGSVIRACMDVDVGRANSLSSYYKIPVVTTDPQEIFNDHSVRLIYIASNHSSHAEYAIKALRSSKDVYIEKPHVVSCDQLRRLVQTMADTEGKVFLGFNRPRSRFGTQIQAYLNREHGSGMYNWFVAAHEIDPEHWYFRPEEGGRVLGNLCHWTDFLLNLVPEERRYPIRINPTSVTRNDTDIAVTYTFGDSSVAVISFSAKGHTFEGVREHFSAHKGNCLISMRDYRTLTVDVGPIKRRYFNWHRDHGHERNILSAFRSVKENQKYARAKEMSYIWNTGWLFLKTKEALELHQPMTIDSFASMKDEILARQDLLHEATPAKS